MARDDLVPTDIKESVPEFREIFETNIRFVWRSLHRLGVRQSDVLDQAQKVFLTAHSKLAEFEGRSKISVWQAITDEPHCIAMRSQRKRPLSTSTRTIEMTYSRTPNRAS
jgi:DNA-directed RNA polymerase specialized sigma24 family protein